jgi:hypothetical protein
VPRLEGDLLKLINVSVAPLAHIKKEENSN